MVAPAFIKIFHYAERAVDLPFVKGVFINFITTAFFFRRRVSGARMPFLALPRCAFPLDDISLSSSFAGNFLQLSFVFRVHINIVRVNPRSEQHCPKDISACLPDRQARFSKTSPVAGDTLPLRISFKFSKKHRYAKTARPNSTPARPFFHASDLWINSVSPPWRGNRRQLEKIARQNRPRKRRRFFASLHRPAHSLHGIKQSGRKHRHLVNDKNFWFSQITFTLNVLLDKIFNISIVRASLIPTDHECIVTPLFLYAWRQCRWTQYALGHSAVLEIRNIFVRA